MKIFQRVQEIWSRQESATDGLTDELTDEGQPYNLLSAMHRGINMPARGSLQDHLLQTIFKICKLLLTRRFLNFFLLVAKATRIMHGTEIFVKESFQTYEVW